jgi:hypothetical protein
VPNWSDIVKPALNAALVYWDIPLIGWDIAPVERGGVIVELNENPDFLLPQLADRRGALDGTMKRFLAASKRQEAAWRRAALKTISRRNRNDFLRRPV